MYRILIADDESDSRRGLKRFLDKHAPGFQVVAAAEDGDEALRQSELFLPEVIITDINMPKMDGLEFLESVRELLPDVQLLVISGYDKFEYAVQCLRLGVREYLLKPVDTAQLLTVLADIKKELDEQNALWQRVEDTRGTAADLQNAAQRIFLGETLPEELPEGNYCAAVMRGCQDYEETISLIQLKFHGFGYVATVARNEKFCLLVFALHKEKEYQGFLRVTRVLTLVHNYIRKEKELWVNFFLGRMASDQEELRGSIREALECAETIFFAGIPAVVSFQELVSDLEREYPIWENKVMQKLILAAECGNEKETQSQLASLEEWADREKLMDSALIKELMVSAGMQAAADLMENENKITGRELYQYRIRIREAKDFSELSQAFLDFTDGIRRRKRQDTGKRLPLKEQVDPIIRRHLTDSEFSLNEVAARLFISPNYLRTLWKQEMGMTFTEYVTNLRMEEAKILLKGQAMKVSDVAERVGYRDSRYFSSSFRKLYNMSPGEFQSQERRSEKSEE